MHTHMRLIYTRAIYNLHAPVDQKKFFMHSLLRQKKPVDSDSDLYLYRGIILLLHNFTFLRIQTALVL